MITRQRFLQLGAAAGAGLVVPTQWTARARAAVRVDGSSLAKYVDQLPVPPVWTAGQLSTRGLTMASATHRFHRDLGPSATYGYGGASYLGPTIEVKRGNPVQFVARNRLGPHPLGIDESLHGPDAAADQQFPRVSLHLHGGYTEPASDGYPEDTFTPGQNHLYRYANDQQAGSTWYHDHALGITRLNVYAGLAGFYLIRDSSVEAGLPPRPFEIPLAIQDKSFLENGATSPLGYPDPWAPEFFGDVAVVNGKAWPNLDVGRGKYRFRLLNGSSSRIYNLFLSGGLPFSLIGTDEGFLPAPVSLSNIVLAPGERADVVVDFEALAAGQKVRLLNGPLPPGVVSPAEIELPELMQFTVTRRAGFRGPLPSSFGPFTTLDASAAVGSRNLLLTEIVDPGTGDPVMAVLNNRPWHTTDVELPKVHTLEQWNLINLTEDTHPIHLHLVQFQPLNRQAFDVGAYLSDVFGVPELHPAHVGSGTRPYPGVEAYVTGAPVPPAPYEAGWKDTVQAHPGTVTRILVPFGRGAAPGIPFGRQHAFTGEYVWHCHILDHEDNEMMLPYRVVS